MCVYDTRSLLLGFGFGFGFEMVEGGVGDLNLDSLVWFGLMF